MRNLHAGFTMIEFLIVMVLAGLIATLGGGAYISSLNKGKDAKRIEDVKTIQKGFEMYYAQRNTYNTCDAMAASSSFQGGVPKDPTTNENYYVDGNCNASAYCVCAELRNQDYFKKYGNAVNGSSNTTCSFAASASEENQHFCVQNVQ